ncbi:MAG: DUF2155 domain-containing protein [Rhodobacteraceae bacterium]|nr:DUF2155 domain-containing protein [Paracoccaceae bacterium]MBR9819738.1 DUF2155 domain-containing protein [Paracoccaceae bacterium]
MRRLALLPLLLTLAVPVHAQENVGPGTGALLRGLDKINAETQDLELATGQRGQIGSLTVTLGACRYPLDNPAGDAFAFLTIRDTRAENPEQPIFEGWMMASSPALNALDHFRYDIWVLSCVLPEGAALPQDAPVEAPEDVPQDPDQPVD